MTSRQRPRVIDLFAGAGLLSGAFQLERFSLIQSVEADRAAAASYANNIGKHVTHGDVDAVIPKGRCEVLIAGPPCQGFSTLGRRDPADPRNRLSLKVVDWARAVQPEVVLIENVPAFLEAPVWNLLQSKLRRLGYQVTSMILNAADYGVPQNRSRSFTIASRVGLPQVPRPVNRHVTVREAWRGLPRTQVAGMQHIAPIPSDLALARMKHIPSQGDKRDIMRSAPHLVPKSWWNIPNQATDVWGRMRWDAPCNTLRTCFQNPSKGRYIHPQANRVITIREGARLQTVPDNWHFFGSPSEMTRQIGNGVPVLLGRAVAREVSRLFL